MGSHREDKVWVIDETKQGVVDEAKPGLVAAPLNRPTRLMGPAAPKATRSGRRLLTRILLGYLLGPFAPGRWHRIWTPAGALGLLSMTALLLSGKLDGAALAGAHYLPRLLHGLAALSLLLVLSGWYSSIFRLGEDRSNRRGALPASLRKPGIVAFLGLWLPGIAFLLAGSPRRAALAFWNVGILVGALFFLLSMDSPAPGQVWIGFELIVAGALATIVVTGFVWITMALDGLRLQLASARVAGGLSGDRLALLLMASLAVFFLGFQPVAVSEDLHARAEVLASQGYRVIPLHLERAALRLDGSRPDYWLRAADYCEALGREQEAARYRGVLWLRYRELRNTLGPVRAAAWRRTPTQDEAGSSAVPTL